MNKLSLEKFNSQIARLQNKLKKYSKVLTVLFFAVSIIALLIWLYLRQPHPIKKNVPNFETNQPQGQESPQPKESTSDAANKSGTTSATTRNKCCTNAHSGISVAPSFTNCMEYEFGKTISDLDPILTELEGTTGLVFRGTSDKRNLNGFISSITGKTSLSKYAIYLYSGDTTNDEYNPPYTYKSTSCTEGTKIKITKALDQIKATL